MIYLENPLFISSKKHVLNDKKSPNDQRKVQSLLDKAKANDNMCQSIFRTKIGHAKNRNLLTCYSLR